MKNKCDISETIYDNWILIIGNVTKWEDKQNEERHKYSEIF